MLSHYIETQMKEYCTNVTCQMSGVRHESHLTEAKERNVSCVFESSVFLTPSHFQHTA